ncbi:TPA: EscU/YscU/HrcU family type III secretion system export apparatus switch protein [Escherichia coli]
MANKTEKPTQKKLKDAAKKGQSFKFKDLTTVVILLVGTFTITSYFSLNDVMQLYRYVIYNGFDVNEGVFFRAALFVFFKVIGFVLFFCIMAAILPTLLQTKFVLATKAIKIDFSVLNPVKGFKKIFGIKTLKELFKSVFLLVVLSATVYLFWLQNRKLVFLQVFSEINGLYVIWGTLFKDLIFFFLGFAIIILVLDFVVEFLLYIKDMMMDKQEIKREFIEQEGHFETKARRRELHFEILSEQTKSDIRSSKMLVMNPTHIAIGIYFNPKIAPAPFISVVETNQCALAAKKYATEVGVPVIRDIRLARKLYKTHSKYSFVDLEHLDEVLRLIIWLEQVENTH